MILSDTLLTMPTPLHIFIACFVVGTLLRGSSLLTKSHTNWLTQLVFCITLPATILISLDRTALEPSAWKLPLAACVITLSMVFCVWPFTHLFQLPRKTQGGLLLATGCINSVYFAYPVTLATFGEQGLAHAVLFDLGQTTLTLTVLYGIAIWHGPETPTIRSAAIRFLSAPPFWALVCILSIKLVGFRLPPLLVDILTPLHLATTPLASVVLGLSISFTAVRQTIRLATVGVVIRMGGGLVLGYLAAVLLELTDVQRAVVITIAAMPSAVSAVIIAAETGLDEELVSSIVGLSICTGVAILPWLPQVAMMLLR